MRAIELVLATGMAIFTAFFLDAFARQGETVDLGGHAARGAFEFFGAIVSLYLLSRCRNGKASLFDWLGCAAAVVIAGIGFAGAAITLFALYFFVRDPHDLNTRAAGTVAAAVAIQAPWAPLIFSKLSFLLLKIDGGVVGWLVSLFVPGASWSGTVVSTPSGHDVAIYETCASFHNLSLASLCWVTLTMLHRPYSAKDDIHIGLAAALIQFGFNIWRRVFVCLSAPIYEFWHEGWGSTSFLLRPQCARSFSFNWHSFGVTGGSKTKLNSK